MAIAICPTELHSKIDVESGSHIHNHTEDVMEEFPHRDHGTSRIVSAFVVRDCDDEAKAQREEVRQAV